MPGDVTGSLVYDTRTAAFTFRPGPVFTNLLLADEINRTPPKTQAALLELTVAMIDTARERRRPRAVRARPSPCVSWRWSSSGRRRPRHGCHAAP